MPEIGLRERAASGFYTYAGNQPLPEKRIRSPREIVADLHTRIAAKSPRHAKLVADFEALPREPEPDWDEWEQESLSVREIAQAKRRARLRQYTDLRIQTYKKHYWDDMTEINRQTAQIQNQLWVAASQSAMYCWMISAKFVCGFSPSRAARSALAPLGQFATMPAMRSSRTKRTYSRTLAPAT